MLESVTSRHRLLFSSPTTTSRSNALEKNALQLDEAELCSVKFNNLCHIVYSLLLLLFFSCVCILNIDREIKSVLPKNARKVREAQGTREATQQKALVYLFVCLSITLSTHRLRA